MLEEARRSSAQPSGPGLHGVGTPDRGPRPCGPDVPTAGRAVWRLPAIAALAV